MHPFFTPWKVLPGGRERLHWEQMVNFAIFWSKASTFIKKNVISHMLVLKKVCRWKGQDSTKFTLLWCLILKFLFFNNIYIFTKDRLIWTIVWGLFRTLKTISTMVTDSQKHCPLKRVVQVRKDTKENAGKVQASNEHLRLCLNILLFKKQAKILNVYTKVLIFQLIFSHEFSTHTSKSGSLPYHKVLVTFLSYVCRNFSTW